MRRVKHVVLFKVKPEVNDQQIEELFSALHRLRHSIPGLFDVSAGKNNSPEGLGRGFTHGFVMTFADESSRDAYLPHPDHVTVAEQLLELVDGGVDGVTVIDWAG